MVDSTEFDSNRFTEMETTDIVDESKFARILEADRPELDLHLLGQKRPHIVRQSIIAGSSALMALTDSY